MKKGTQLLEIYALEIQMYTAQKNNKKLKVFSWNIMFSCVLWLSIYKDTLHIDSFYQSILAKKIIYLLAL